MRSWDIKERERGLSESATEATRQSVKRNPNWAQVCAFGYETAVLICSEPEKHLVLIHVFKRVELAGSPPPRNGARAASVPRTGKDCMSPLVCSQSVSSVKSILLQLDTLEEWAAGSIMMPHHTNEAHAGCMRRLRAGADIKRVAVDFSFNFTGTASIPNVLYLV